MANGLDLVGETPLIQLERTVPSYAADLYMKCEMQNPTGHYDDRVALNMLEVAQESEAWTPKTPLTLFASARFALSAACMCAIKGMTLTAYLDEEASEAEIEAIEAYGAEVVEKTAERRVDARLEAASHAAKDGGLLLDPRQDPAHPAIHEFTTGPEVADQMKAGIDAIVLPLHTGGLVAGISMPLRKAYPNIKVYGVERATTALSYGEHSYDYTITLTEEAARDRQIRLAIDEGLKVDLDTAACVAGAIEVAKDLGPDRQVVVLGTRA